MHHRAAPISTTPGTQCGVTRRSAVRAAAWATPAVALASAAPAFASSGVSLVPYSDFSDAQALISAGLGGSLATLQSLGYTENGAPRCAVLDFRAYSIHFTASRNGAPAQRQEMTFTLTGDLRFKDGSKTASALTDDSGRAYPPPFMVTSGSTVTTGYLVATFETESATVTIPVSDFNAVCGYAPGGAGWPPA